MNIFKCRHSLPRHWILCKSKMFIRPCVFLLVLSSWRIIQYRARPLSVLLSLYKSVRMLSTRAFNSSLLAIRHIKPSNTFWENFLIHGLSGWSFFQHVISLSSASFHHAVAFSGMTEEIAMRSWLSIIHSNILPEAGAGISPKRMYSASCCFAIIHFSSEESSPYIGALDFLT